MNQETLNRFSLTPPTLAPVQPTLTTARLVLRPFELGDASRVRELAGDRDVAATTRLIPHPYPEGMAEAWISTLPTGYQAGRGASFAMVLKEGPLIGSIGLMVSQADQHAEMGYWVGKEYWNRGFCTEAAKAVLEYAFETLRLERVFANYMARNLASGRVLAKIGMRIEGCLRRHRGKWGQFEDLMVCGVLRGEFVAARAASRVQLGAADAGGSSSIPS